MALANASLCAACQSIFDGSETLLERYQGITYNPRDMVAAAMNGCRICICFQHTLTTRYGSVENIKLNGRLDPAVQDPFSVPGYLRIYPKDDLNNWSHYLYIEQNAADESSMAPETLTAQHTKDRRCLKQVSEWLQDCLGSHERCRQAKLTHTYATFPARLLEIGPTLVRLVLKEDLHEISSAHYITLSHRWQAEVTPKLLQSNFSAMQQSIDEGLLPQTFQDTIFLARELSMRYIWIDALCIIQDDVIDVHREISLMGEIYQGALLNIGGLLDQGLTRETAVGLFTERDLRHHTPFIINVRWMGSGLQLRAYGSVAFEEIAEAPLMSRGWVLQERLLSPRSIYFGGQLHWECAQSSACETFPEKKPQPFWGRLRFGHSVPLRISTLLNEEIPWNPEAEPNINVYQSWMQVVERFTSCKLSFEEDCFPALSGLQRKYEEVLRDRYLAGLWFNDIINELAWFVKHDMQGRTTRTYPKKYRAPSWSWAAVTTAVGFPAYWDIHRRSFPKQTIAKVEFVEKEENGALNSTKVCSGKLRMSGLMVQSKNRLCKWKAPNLTSYLCGYEVYDSGYTENRLRFGSDSFHFVLHHYDRAYVPNVRGEHQSVRVVIGLIVEIVDQRLQLYRRIGMFRHCMGPPTDPSDYDEFVDWDPSKSERHTITIV